MKHQTLPTIELIRDFLADVDLYHATHAGPNSRDEIVTIVTGCVALLYHAEIEGELQLYAYANDLERKVMRYQSIYQPEKPAAAPVRVIPHSHQINYPVKAAS